jgi:D-alanyl-D-alanine carboxypeptidase
MHFDMGSTGKIVLGPLIVKLAEEGLINLDDPIRTYLPDFTYADGSITIRQLLNHTNGLYMMVKHPDSPFHKSFVEIDHSRWWTIEEIFTELGGEPYFPPGEGWCYTQAGYQIATLIVESITGQTVPDAVQAYLLDPVGIDSMLLDFSNSLPEDIDIAHPWVYTDNDSEYKNVFKYSRNWIASLSRILFYSNSKALALWGHRLFTGKVLNQDSVDEMLDFYRMDDWCGEPPLITGYGLGVQEFDTSLTHGLKAWGHLGSIPGYRSILAHLPDYGVTLAVMTNTDSDDAMVAFDALLMVLVKHLGINSETAMPFPVKPIKQPSGDIKVFDSFQKDSLFCDHNPYWKLTATSDGWINISLDWVVGTDMEKAENAWNYHTHTITINGEEIPDLDQYTHDVISYTVKCQDETLEIWAKGLSIYLPPLPPGKYDIKWHSQITGKFDNGWVTYEQGNYMEMVAELNIQ